MSALSHEKGARHFRRNVELLRSHWTIVDHKVQQSWKLLSAVISIDYKILAFVRQLGKNKKRQAKYSKTICYKIVHWILQCWVSCGMKKNTDSSRVCRFPMGAFYFIFCCSDRLANDIHFQALFPFYSRYCFSISRYNLFGHRKTKPTTYY